MNHALSEAQLAAYLASEKQKQKHTPDDKLWIQETSRPLGTITYFTSRGDDPEIVSDVGNGQFLKVFHEIGNDNNESVLLDLNIAENMTYIHEGYVNWKGCDFDYCRMEIVATPTVYASDTNTNFNIYGGAYIIPAAGNGTITVQPEDMVLIEMPLSRDKGTRRQGFWNADYNSTTHQFENVTPAPAGDGHFNMFSVEVTLARFTNDLLLLGDGFMRLQSADVDQLTQGMRIKFSALTNTDVDDHDWKICAILTLNREKIA